MGIQQVNFFLKKFWVNLLIQINVKSRAVIYQACGFAVFHGSALVDENTGEGIIIFGKSGIGKTSLLNTVKSIYANFKIISDDLVIINPTTLTLIPTNNQFLMLKKHRDNKLDIDLIKIKQNSLNIYRAKPKTILIMANSNTPMATDKTGYINYFVYNEHRFKHNFLNFLLKNSEEMCEKLAQLEIVEITKDSVKPL